MNKLLDQIDSPDDLKKLPREQLPALAQEIRDMIVETVHTTGGHLGSSLGAVELTVALHYLFDFQVDRLVFDVGHQSYPHKLLTGRRRRFHTLRQKDGLSGFTNRFESPYDVYTMGHAGTAASAALGIAVGDALLERKRDVVAVVGDAALGCGVAFEALNHGGALDRRLLVVLNDNRWSISKTVGALSHYLNRIRTGNLYNQAKKTLHGLIQSMPLIGEKMDRSIEQMIQILKTTVAPGQIFEELGFRYYGPVDGHDIAEVLSTLEYVRTLPGVVIAHMKTEKGKGMPQLEEKHDRYHGVSPKPGPEPQAQQQAQARSVEPAVVLPASQAGRKPRTYTQCFTDALKAAARRDPRVVALTAAMPDGTGLTGFAKEFPDRFFDAGIAEQHTVAFASGLATAGLRPVAAIYSTFLQRGYDQVFQEVLLQRTPVVFVLDRAGVVGEDGATHNGLFDLAYLGAMPDIVLMAPRDGTELGLMLDLALTLDLPSAIRIPRANVPDPERCDPGRAPLELGKAEVLREGGDLALLAYGSMVCTALEAADLLEKEGFSAEVVNARFARPLDMELLADLCRRHERVYTLEEHAVRLGFGSTVVTALAQAGPLEARVIPMGVPDAFQEHGSRKAILKDLGLDAQGIVRRILSQSPVGQLSM